MRVSLILSDMSFLCAAVPSHQVEPRLRERLYRGLAAMQMFYCQASLAAFDDQVRIIMGR